MHPLDAPFALIDTPEAWTPFDAVEPLAVAIHDLRAGRKVDLAPARLADADRARPSVAVIVYAADGAVAERRSALLAEGLTAADLMAALRAARPSQRRAA